MVERAEQTEFIEDERSGKGHARDAREGEALVSHAQGAITAAKLT